MGAVIIISSIVCSLSSCINYRLDLFNAHADLSLRSSRTLVKGLGLKDGLRGGSDHRPEVKSIVQVRCNLYRSDRFLKRVYAQT